MGEGRVRFDYAGTRVLVTGGSRGIGAAIARAFRDAGAHVTITGRRAGPADYPGDLSGLDYRPLDLERRGDPARVAGALAGLDVLVNNAGANFPGGRNEAEPDVFEASVAVNLFGAYRLAVACRPLLQRSELAGGASVVNLASMASFFAVPLVPGYAAAKAGIVQMTKNLAVAWAGDGIRVNAVAPGLIASDMTAPMRGVDALEKPQLQRTPLARWGTPEDVAPAVLFLASPAAGFVTGETLCVDGGYAAA